MIVDKTFNLRKQFGFQHAAGLADRSRRISQKQIGRVNIQRIRDVYNAVK